VHRSPCVLIVAVLCIQTYSVAAAKNLDAIVAFVRPAYTAMNFTTLCAQDDPWFLIDTLGPRGTALKYAEHVKDEVIASLTHDESVLVLKMAADEARSAARSELRKLIPKYPTYRSVDIAAWCRGDAIRFVRTFVQQHDERHETLLNELQKAKRQLRGLD
jgi:hypothetical protein